MSHFYLQSAATSNLVCQTSGGGDHFNKNRDMLKYSKHFLKSCSSQLNTRWFCKCALNYRIRYLLMRSLGIVHDLQKSLGLGCLSLLFSTVGPTVDHTRGFMFVYCKDRQSKYMGHCYLLEIILTNPRQPANPLYLTPAFTVFEFFSQVCLLQRQTE